MRRIILSIAALLLLISCNQPAKESIRIGVMPDAGALPLLLMEHVEIVPFLSARERDTAMQLGDLEGMMTDMVAVISYHQNNQALKVLTLTESRFMIVGIPDFDPEGEWQVGISENTVIEYMVDSLAGDRALEKIGIPQVPVRMEMLRSGKIPLACLTDAMAWPLLSNGFSIVKDQKDTDLAPAVLAFSAEFADENPEAIKQFTSEWNSSVQKINTDPGEYQHLLLEQVRLPETESDPYPVPVFRPVTLPTREQADSVISWYKNRYNTKETVSYNDLVIR